LREQPHRELAEQVDQLYQDRFQLAEEQYRAAANRTRFAGDDVQLARKNLDDLIVEKRQELTRRLGAVLGPQQDRLTADLRAMGASNIQPYLMINMLHAVVPSSALDKLEADESIAEVFPVSIHRAHLNISVPTFGAPSFWNASITGVNQSVAVLDTGLKSNHPAFHPTNITSAVFLTNGLRSACFSDDLTSVDNVGHGTHVAGIVMSQGSSGWENHQGVAKGLTSFYNLKIGYKCPQPGQPNSGSSDSADVIAAFDWALQNTPVTIFNYSFGGPADGDDDPLTRVIDLLSDTFGLTIVVSAGNDGPDPQTISSPGLGYNILSVANMDDKDTLSRSDDSVDSTSSRGPTVGQRFKPDIAAPGTDIWSTAYDWDGGFLGGNQDFIPKTGTSMAAPHITGAAALLNQAGVFSALAKKAVLINSTDTHGWTADKGWGYANLAKTFQTSYAVNTIQPRGQANSFFFYRSSGAIPSGAATTLTWNRHFVNGTPFFNDLDLYLYNRLGTELDSSATAIQNVEQVSSPSSTSAVVKVKAFSTSFGGGAGSEVCALALPTTTFIPSIGPSLSVSCTPPSSVPANSNFSVTCTVRNNGDLEAFNVLTSLTVPAGFSGGSTQNFGTLAPAAQVSRTWTITSGTTSGTFQASSTSSSYGESFSASTSFSVTPCRAPGTFSLVAPGNGQTLSPTNSVTLTWLSSANANSYDVFFGTSSNPPFVGNQIGTSRTVTVTPGQTYFWRVVAKVNCGSATATAGVRSFSVQQAVGGGGSVRFSSSAYSVNENAGTATITVTRSGGTQTGTIQYATSNGTATAGSDYTQTSGLLVFGTNETSKSFTVSIINDSAIEANESVNITLHSPSSSFILGSPSSATLTIVDNDVLLPPTARPASNVTSNTFSASWNSAPGAAGYRLDVSTNSSFTSFVSGFQNLDVGNALNRTVSGLTASTPYHYRVRAYSGASTSVNSNTVALTTAGPIIFVEQGTTNLAAALDSVTWQRGPFSVLNLFNFSADRHTRVVLFTSDLGLNQPDPSQLTVQAGGRVLTVESVGPAMGASGTSASYIIVRLPDGLPIGNLPLLITLRGFQSVNSPSLGIIP
jgi:subtilisin family serine protease